MFNDPIVDEVRKARDNIAKKFNYDLEAIFEYYQKKQKAHPERIVDLSDRKIKEKK